MFHYCTSLTVITVDAGNLHYSSLDGVLFDKNQTMLIRCPAGKSRKLSVPSNVTSIEGRGVLWLHQPDEYHGSQQRHQNPRYGAFLGCTSLTAGDFEGTPRNLSVGPICVLLEGATNATVYLFAGDHGLAVADDHLAELSNRSVGAARTL